MGKWIYYVEDDTSIRELVLYALKTAEFQVMGFENAASFYKRMKEQQPDLILLDIMLPDEDGVSILKKLKSRPDTENIPVIMMTAKSSEYDKVLGLDSGADDYITKPFGVMELISRVKAVIRRSDRSKGSAGEVLKIGELVLDEQKHEVYARGQEVSLTFKEFELLSYLMKNRGLVLSRDKILNTIWNYEYEGESRTVDVHIGSLRQKLGTCGDFIKTIRGIGYKIEDLAMKQLIYQNCFWVALTTILFVSFFFVFSYNQTIHDQKEEGMREEAEFISALLEKQGDADVGFQAAAGKTDFRITLIAENGMVLYDNKVKDVSGMENHAKRPEILKASKNGEGSSSRISSTIQSETYYYARKLSDGRYLRLSSEGLSIWSGFVQVLPALTGIALFVIFITFLIAHFLTRNIVEAINGIDLENPMEKVVFPELGVLQKRLGFQNRKIQTQMQNMKEQEYKLTAITENMNEGLIMLDADRKIQYMNQSCQDLFEVSGSKFIGQTISGFCDSIPMQEVVESALKGNVHTAMQELDHKKVQYFGNPILENQKIQGIIILVLDITERERTERMRKEFSANVSHELKTPLTSISGFAELMENHLVAPEDVPEFAAKIHRESERLLTLVNDIIKVSQLDDKEVYYGKENIDLLSFAKEVCDRLEPMAQSRNVTVELSGDAVLYLASRQLMNDLFYNLIENGIKYNKPNGKLWVTVSEKKGHPCISVKDTGIGVPMKYQSRIFERFFRVDKSHSKQTGGTGLGLSIVKHVVEYYGGYIEIHSKMEEGTEIVVHL